MGVKIFNGIGELVFESFSIAAGQTELSLPDLSAGIYTVVVTVADTIEYTKIIKVDR